ncbi:MAG: tetratricopeptide repeat protein [Desulfuromonas sp.]|nr:tetratricopeptide repeat protein [Desulfuromonas sp.]
MRPWWLLSGILLLWGCALPRLIVLNDPLDARQHNDLGVAYEQRSEIDLAGREYRRAAELDEGWALPRINLGNVAARQGDWQGAAGYYREALARHSDNAEAMNNLAWALTQAGRPGEALPWARRAVASAAGDPRCWDTLAEVYLALGRPAEAREAVAQGLALNPPPALRAALESKLSSN